MALIHDMTEKIKAWQPAKPVVIMAEDHAEKLTCLRCGRQYTSSGKKDPGFCRDCRKEMDEENAKLNGGPLDGEIAYEKQG